MLLFESAEVLLEKQILDITRLKHTCTETGDSFVITELDLSYSLKFGDFKFYFISDKHANIHFLQELTSREWPSEVSSPLHPAVWALVLQGMAPLWSRYAPATPLPSPTGINRKVFIPLENFSFNLSFLCSSVGAKSYPLRESSWRAHACLHGEWFTDVYREWIDQRQSHDRRSIKHQIKDGNPRAEHKMKIRHFYFLHSFF